MACLKFLALSLLPFIATAVSFFLFASDSLKDTVQEEIQGKLPELPEEWVQAFNQAQRFFSSDIEFKVKPIHFVILAVLFIFFFWLIDKIRNCCCNCNGDSNLDELLDNAIPEECSVCGHEMDAVDHSHCREISGRVYSPRVSPEKYDAQKSAYTAQQLKKYNLYDQHTKVVEGQKRAEDLRKQQEAERARKELERRMRAAEEAKRARERQAQLDRNRRAQEQRDAALARRLAAAGGPSRNVINLVDSDSNYVPPEDDDGGCVIL
jgi:hypothetical protein